MAETGIVKKTFNFRLRSPQYELYWMPCIPELWDLIRGLPGASSQRGQLQTDFDTVSPFSKWS